MEKGEKFDLRESDSEDEPESDSTMSNVDEREMREIEEVIRSEAEMRDIEEARREIREIEARGNEGE